MASLSELLSRVRAGDRWYCTRCGFTVSDENFIVVENVPKTAAYRVLQHQECLGRFFYGEVCMIALFNGQLRLARYCADLDDATSSPALAKVGKPGQVVQKPTTVDKTKGIPAPALKSAQPTRAVQVIESGQGGTKGTGSKLQTTVSSMSGVDGDTNESANDSDSGIPDNLLSQQLGEFQRICDTSCEQLTLVADKLDEYAQKLSQYGVDVDSGEILRALANDLSLIRHDLQKSFVDSIYSCAAVGDASLFSHGEAEKPVGDLSFSDAQVQEQLANDSPDAFHLNLSDLPRESNSGPDHSYRPPKSVAIQQPLSNISDQTDSMLDQSALPKHVSIGTVVTPTNHDARYEELRQQFEREMESMRQDYDRKMIDLRKKNEQLEGYTKKIKALYQKATNSSAADLENQLNQLISTEQLRLENIEGVVKQQHENQIVSDADARP